MEYTKVAVTLTPVNEIASDLLMAQMGELGFESFSETEYGFDAFIPSKDYNSSLLKSIHNPLEGIKLSFKDEVMPDINWNEEWEKNYFQPIVIANKCVVRSPFHILEGNYKYEILIEPKMSFGTGHHSTTSQMLQFILETDVKGKSVLDMGCGTGILGMLCSMKKASSIVGIDIDEWAYNNAIENLSLNKIKNMTIEIGGADRLANRSFDIILANINRNILLEDIKYYQASLIKGGQLLLSGFYQEDLDIINQECEKYKLKYISHKNENNWVAASYILAE
nr:50S ribosomal protein L11 methyltransferase [uncultured Carboxylicivirga sp.]